MTMIKNKLNSKRKVIIIAAIIIAAIAFFVGGIILYNQFQIEDKTSTAKQDTSLKVFHESDLLPFDGSDSLKPIYIGLDGLVYDVTAGKSFYATGGSYHYLAGKDSSKDLDLIGGDIIKSKYPIVGKLYK